MVKVREGARMLVSQSTQSLASIHVSVIFDTFSDVILIFEEGGSGESPIWRRTKFVALTACLTILEMSLSDIKSPCSCNAKTEFCVALALSLCNDSSSEPSNSVFVQN